MNRNSLSYVGVWAIYFVGSFLLYVLGGLDKLSGVG